MKLSKIYKKQVKASQNISPKTGYTQNQSNEMDHWTTRIAALSAFLGWDHEILIDDLSDKYDSCMELLSSLTPDEHEFSKHKHAYEMAVCVAIDGRAMFGQI